MAKTNKQKEYRLKEERLKELLTYDSMSGVFTWKSKSSRYANRTIIGNIAGTTGKVSGYIIIQIDNQLFQAHRLAWFYHYGVWPSEVINHKNQIKTDNRIENLEDVSHRTNTENQCKRSRPLHQLPMGVSAVKWKGVIVAYRSHWTGLDGKRYNSHCFNIRTCGGTSAAIAGAKAYRDVKLIERNNEGAQYTDLHGKY